MATIYNKNTVHVPKIVRNVFGFSTDRGTMKLPAVDSSAFYLGSFVGIVDSGDDSAPTSVEYGVRPFNDDDLVLGIAVGFTRPGTLLSVFEDNAAAGSITDGTGDLPIKYTFASTNDESNTTSMKGELVEVLPIMPGDVLEVATWGGSTVAVARGTTTAWGTTTSSANNGVFMSINATYPFAVTESTAAATGANLDVMTTEVDGKKPANSKHVYVMLVRSVFGKVVPN